MKRFVAALLLCLVPSLALAGAGTITVQDAGGLTRTYDVVTDGSGNFVGKGVICDGAAAANCASVDAGGHVATVPSMGVLSHASGTSALLTSLVVNAASSKVSSYNCTAITGGAAGFCIGYNGTTAPSTGALTAANVLDFCYFDSTARGCSLAHLNGGVTYSTGFVVLITSATTPYTYTTGTDTGAIEGDYQ
jgi:hypothetical protein